MTLYPESDSKPRPRPLGYELELPLDDAKAEELSEIEVLEELKKLKFARTQLSSFIPETIKYILSMEESPLTPPKNLTFYSVGLWADVSGFTPMTEYLSERGPRGFCRLAGNLNPYLGQIVKEIVCAGGDIIKFAGDAILCVWPPPLEMIRSNDFQAQKALCEDTLNRVIQCAMEIQEKYGAMQISRDIKELTLKLGIGVGECNLLVVGGEMDRSEFLSVGEAFVQAFACEKACDGGRVVISKKCRDILGETRYQFRRTRDNYMIVRKTTRRKLLRKALKIAEIATDEFAQKLCRCLPSAVVKHLRMPTMRDAGELRHVTIMFIRLPFKLRQFRKISREIVADLNSCMLTLQKIIYKYHGSVNKFNVDDKGCMVVAIFGMAPVAENNDAERAVVAAMELTTVLAKTQQAFVKKRTLTETFSEVAIESILKEVSKAERSPKSTGRKRSIHSSHRRRSIMSAAACDGHTVTASGKLLPPVPGGDGCVKKAEAHTTTIGLASGTVFMGLVGNKGSRQEFTILGDKVNLAARLMCKAKDEFDKFGAIAVDESVVDECIKSAHIVWQYIDEIAVKGKRFTIPVWKPTKPRKLRLRSFVDGVGQIFAKAHFEVDAEEVAKAKRALDQMCEMGKGSVILVEGERGLGKTRLLRSCVQQRGEGEVEKFWTLEACGDWMFSTLPNAPWQVWKKIFYQFRKKLPLDVPSFAALSPSGQFKDMLQFREGRTHRESFTDFVLKFQPELFPHLYLINDLVPVSHCTEEFLLYREPQWDYLELGNLRRKRNPWMKGRNKWILYEILIALLQWGANFHMPIVIVLDRFQWLRKHDWDFSKRMMEAIKYEGLRNVSLIVGSSIMDNPRYTPRFTDRNYGEEYTRLRRDFTNLRLAPSIWDSAKIKHFVKEAYKAKTGDTISFVGDDVVNLLQAMCSGRPGFIKSFYDSLVSRRRKKNIILLKQKRSSGKMSMELKPWIRRALLKNLMRLGIPRMIEAVTTRQLDAVDPEEMVCLRTAAIICIVNRVGSIRFTTSAVIGCHPIQYEHRRVERIAKSLQLLEKIGFISKVLKKPKKARKRHLLDSTVLTHASGGGSLEFAAVLAVADFHRDDDDVKFDDSDDESDYGDSDADNPLSQSRRKVSRFWYRAHHSSHSLLPKTASLLRPTGSRRFNKGVLFQKVKGLRKESSHMYVLRGRNLYWMRSDEETTATVQGMCDFENVLSVKRVGLKRIRILAVDGTEYLLRGEIESKMAEWFQLFEEALEERGSVDFDSDCESHGGSISLEPPIETKSSGGSDAKSIGDSDTKSIGDSDAKSSGGHSVEHSSEDFVIDDGSCDELLLSDSEPTEIDGVLCENVTYAFAYGFMRETVYKQMLFRQRAKIHTCAHKYYKSIGNDTLFQKHKDYMNDALSDAPTLQLTVINPPIASANCKTIRRKKREEIIKRDSSLPTDESTEPKKKKERPRFFAAASK